MTLPIGKEQFELVTMTLNGMEYAAAYVSDGLEHRWYINPEEGEEVSSDYQVIVKADLTAGYYDFTGLEVGEEREANTVFSVASPLKRATKPVTPRRLSQPDCSRNTLPTYGRESSATGCGPAAPMQVWNALCL